MSGQDLKSTKSTDSDTPHTEQLSSETIERCAQLLATGEMDWPQGLSVKQDTELLKAARRNRRARLVRFIASRIAADIAPEARGRTTEVQP